MSEFRLIDMDGVGSKIENERLNRRARIRALLMGSWGENGYSNIEDIAEAIGASPTTVTKDLKDMSAVKVMARVGGKVARTISWYVLPAYNPQQYNLRNTAQREMLETKVAQVMFTHAVEVFQNGNQVVTHCEIYTGKHVGHYLSQLSWEGILYVMSDDSTSVIHCLSEEHAQLVAYRLSGFRFKETLEVV